MSKMTYSDAELEQFLTDVEADFVERKESWSGDAPDRGRQAICAFANDLPDHKKPGVLFVGAADGGQPSGLSITDDLLLTLSDMKTDGQILPIPSLVVEKRRLKGADLAVVTVQPADSPPVRYKGRIWIRVGPRRGVASAQDERLLNEKRRHGDQPFDVRPLPSCRLEELSRTRFEEEYLPRALSPEIPAANERTFEQRLAACKMVAAADEPIPTVLGILVLAKSPREHVPAAYVQFLRIGGVEWADPIIDEAVFDGPLAAMIRRLDEKLESHNRVQVNLSAGETEKRSYSYPPEALQQLTRNAVLHRAYEQTNAPVRVYWFADRIEIHSPGGPYGIVTAETLGRPGVADYRNPNLAEAMRVLGYVQRFGVGIQIAQKKLQDNGNPPAEFQVDSSRVLVVVRCAPLDRR